MMKKKDQNGSKKPVKNKNNTDLALWQKVKETVTPLSPVSAKKSDSLPSLSNFGSFKQLLDGQTEESKPKSSITKNNAPPKKQTS